MHLNRQLNWLNLRYFMCLWTLVNQVRLPKCDKSSIIFEKFVYIPAYFWAMWFFLRSKTVLQMMIKVNIMCEVITCCKKHLHAAQCARQRKKEEWTDNENNNSSKCTQRKSANSPITNSETVHHRVRVRFFS